MKVKIREHVAQGLGGGYWRAKVVDVPDGQEAPANSTPVPDETPVSDWARDENQEA